MIELHHLDSLAALLAAQSTLLRKQKNEKDTAFVKRIVCAYMNAEIYLRDKAKEELKGKMKIINYTMLIGCLCVAMIATLLIFEPFKSLFPRCENISFGFCRK